MEQSLFWQSAASTSGQRVDTLFFALLILSAAITVLVFALITIFAVRYRHGSPAKRGQMPNLIRREFEIGWTVATLFLFVFVFWWASSSQLGGYNPPDDALEIHVTGKQWMFKTQHSSGVREINELHMPVDTPVRLVMTSEDVIHSFWVPAFRFKRDLIPGRITQGWFQATRTGVFHLFCAELCGTDHSQMGGRVVVMSQADYGAWAAAQPQGDDLEKAGRDLFVSLGCAGCHAGSNAVRAPSLDGIWNHEVPLDDGTMVHVDEAYVRDSILQPRRQIAAGFQPIMPSFAGVVGEDDLIRLVAYIRSLGTVERVTR